eukprot:scaffold97483_cov58-Phaeocystis_antarctica.AAC.3
MRQVVAAGALGIDKQRDRSQARKRCGDGGKPVVAMAVDGDTASTRPRQHECELAGCHTRKRGTPATRVGRGGVLAGHVSRVAMALSVRLALQSSLRPCQWRHRGGGQQL